MKLYLVASIPQVDNCTRYLLMDDARDAEIALDALRFEPAMVDHIDPSFIVEHDRNGFACVRWPRNTSKPGAREWRAIYQAILGEDRA